MRTFVRGILLMTALSCSSAFAQTSTTLCSPPQIPNCVMPQWGAIEPDGTDGLAGPSSSIAAVATRPTMVRVAMSTGASNAIAPKIVIDDGKKYAAETKSLVDAIKAARFDTEGKLVSGSERITAALERVNKVSSNHVLTLYLKASPKLSDMKRSVLNQKVVQLNTLLEGPTKRQ